MGISNSQIKPLSLTQSKPLYDLVFTWLTLGWIIEYSLWIGAGIDSP